MGFEVRRRAPLTVLWISAFIVLGLVTFALPSTPDAPGLCAGREVTIKGTASDDLLLGTSGDDVIHAGDGDDIVEGRGGHDTICGGAGADTIKGGDGDDTLLGGDKADELIGGNGADTLIGGPGPDHLTGVGGDDLLLGGPGGDRLLGNHGEDRLRGGDGADILSGGAGDDDLNGDAGNDTLDGESGNDLLRGGRGNDSLEGRDGDDRLLGGDHRDLLEGGDGIDTCNGGAGTDEAHTCETLANTEIGQLPRPRTSPSSTGVALTFDDGPHPLYTPALLDVLDRYNVKATFFVLGIQVDAYPELTREIADRGHSIQSHTCRHRRLTSWSSTTVAAEFQCSIRSIEKAAGTTPRCQRPPYGATNTRVESIGESLGLSQVMWDVDPADWSRPSASTIAWRVRRYADGGDVVLLHDGGGDRWNTVNALPSIIRGLRDRGLHFETICD